MSMTSDMEEVFRHMVGKVVTYGEIMETGIMLHLDDGTRVNVFSVEFGLGMELPMGAEVLRPEDGE